MRRIMMFNRVTPEGFFADADGKLDWVVPDDAIDGSAVDAMPDGDTVLFGRRTYEMFASFWPMVLASTSAVADPHTPGRFPPSMRAMAQWLHDARKHVFSRTLDDATWHNTEIVRDATRESVEAIKRTPGKSILVFGSGTLVSRLTELGLIDEYQFIVGPLFLGTGRPLFTNVTQRTRLTLEEASPYPSGNVMLRYRRAE